MWDFESGWGAVAAGVAAAAGVGGWGVAAVAAAAAGAKNSHEPKLLNIK